MADNDKSLSPDSSPKTVVMQKKRARRINNWPIMLLILTITVIAVTLGSVAVGRGQASRADIAVTGGKAATDRAREFTGDAEAGIVAPREPETPTKPVTEEPIPPVVKEEHKENKPAEPSVPAPKTPEPPKVPEEVRKLREKRFRQLEAALDGPIKAQIEEVKTKPRSLDAEITEVERQIAALGGQTGDAYLERLAAIKAATEGGATEVDYSRRGDLSRMNQFGSVGGNWRNASEVEAPPANLCVIRTGSVIPATLVSGINSDLPGQIVGQVAQDVYDTPTGKYLLIPQGSRLVGEYSSQVQYGQSRVFAVWQRVVFPDGKALDLGAMPGSSGAGYAGFRDRVNNHYVRIFGSAVMMSAILAGVEMTQNKQDYTQGSNQQRMADALSESLGRVLGGVMAEMLSKNMSIAPTLEIRPGYRFNVMLVKDLEFKRPYRAFDYIQE
jgi:type IV secretion system protein VirB10